MPYEFQFLVDDEVWFSCELKCVRCKGRTASGQRCSRITCIGTPLCWSHMLKEYQLKIMPSTVPAAGKGLFAWHPTSDANIILFRQGDVLLEYEGEMISRAELDRRYDEEDEEHVAPYAYGAGNFVVDAACERGAGSLINHSDQARNINCKFVYDPRTAILSVVATKNIRNGHELFMNYGEGYNELNSERVSHRTRSRKARRRRYYANER